MGRGPDDDCDVFPSREHTPDDVELSPEDQRELCETEHPLDVCAKCEAWKGAAIAGAILESDWLNLAFIKNARERVTALEAKCALLSASWKQDRAILNDLQTRLTSALVRYEGSER